MKKLIALLLAMICLCSVAFADVNTATVIPAQEGDIDLELENGTLPLTVYMKDGKYRVRLNGTVEMTRELKDEIGYWKGGPSGWTTFSTKQIGYRYCYLRYYVQGDSIYVICTWAAGRDLTEKELQKLAVELYDEWFDLYTSGVVTCEFTEYLYASGLHSKDVKYIVKWLGL